MKPLGELVINTVIELKESEKRISTRVSDRDVVIVNANEKM
ncbi:hypothetical protein ACSOV8_16105 [Bacillus halotolerans]